jgi:hypothetical protein
MMVIENRFEIGEMIYLKHDPEQKERLITQISIGGNNALRYCASCGTTETWHYDMELSKEKDQIKTFNDR